MAKVFKSFTHDDVLRTLGAKSLANVEASPHFAVFLNSVFRQDRTGLKIWADVFVKIDRITPSEQDALIALCDATVEAPKPAPSKWSAEVVAKEVKGTMSYATLKFTHADTGEEYTAPPFMGNDLTQERIKAQCELVVKVLEERDATHSTIKLGKVA